MVTKLLHIKRFSHIILPLYLSLSVVSLRVSFEALGVNANGGTHPSTAPTHPKHQAGRITEDDP